MEMEQAEESVGEPDDDVMAMLEQVRKGLGRLVHYDYVVYYSHCLSHSKPHQSTYMPVESQRVGEGA